MATSESFRQDVAKRLASVVQSPDPCALETFPSCLSAEERKYVHHLAEQFGLKHESRGKGDGRCITVRRDPQGQSSSSKTGGSAEQLTLHSEAWEALSHPLLEYASTEEHLQALNEEGSSLFAVGAQDTARLLGWNHSRHDRSVKESPVLSGDPQGGVELQQQRRRLPAWRVREDLLRILGAHRVTLIIGETGCGKSTQIPQFILEGSKHSNVLVTQPRRLSALALASRVAQERGEAVGSSVGYSVHLDSASSASTRLLYCTTGILRRRLLADPLLTGITHLVFDELHERDKVMDFMLIAARDLLRCRPELQLVLMSATMQQDTFRRYFPGCGEVSITGRSFPVEEYYLDEVAPLLHNAGMFTALGPGFGAAGLGFGSWEDRGKEKSFKHQVLVSHVHAADGLCGFAKNASRPLNGRLEEGLFLHDVLQQTKGLAFDLPILEAFLCLLLDGNWDAQVGDLQGRSQCGILVFLPGWDDIDSLKRLLDAHPRLGDRRRFLVLPLHSQVHLEQQREVFKAPKAGVRKIVLSTNIAETSLTIDDIDVVLDCGRSKETSFDRFLQVPTLNTSWVSKASLTQRAGRAGRTAPGVCYHIFARRRAELLDAHRPPEILRSSLDDACLHAQLLLLARRGNKAEPGDGLEGEETALQFLRRAPDPPEESSAADAELRLLCLGALAPAPGRTPQLTALGVHLAALPLTPQLTKALLWANVLGVGESMLSLVSCLQYREPFVGIGDATRPVTLAEANRSICDAKCAFAAPHCSDHLALLQACRGFEEASRKGAAAARQFCKANSLAMTQMQTIVRTKTKLKAELQHRDLLGPRGEGETADVGVLLAALCAGLFPNVANHSTKGRSRLRVNGGRLEALACPTSVASSQHMMQRSNSGTVSGGWFCFQELGQVEEHYSLSGLSRVPIAAMLLLCGEGNLVVRSSTLPEAREAEVTSSLPESREVADEDTPNPFSEWWAVATGGCNSTHKHTHVGDSNSHSHSHSHSHSSSNFNSTPSSSSNLNPPPRSQSQPDRSRTEGGRDPAGDTLVSIPELGDWFSVCVEQEVAHRLQTLRAVLRFLFRLYCCEPIRWQEVVAEGPAAHIVSMAVDILGTDTGGCRFKASAPPAPPAPAPAPAPPPVAKREHREPTTTPRGKGKEPQTPFVSFYPGSSSSSRTGAAGAVTGRTTGQYNKNNQSSVGSRGLYSSALWDTDAEAEGPGRDRDRHRDRVQHPDQDLDTARPQGRSSAKASASAKSSASASASASGRVLPPPPPPAARHESRADCRCSGNWEPTLTAWHGAQPQTCTSCSWTKASDDGCQDLASGLWYCWSCWDSFYTEGQRMREQMAQQTWTGTGAGAAETWSSQSWTQTWGRQWSGGWG